MKNPNITGIIHSIIRLVDACCSVAAGMVVIFCISHIDPPTRTGRRKGIGFAADTSARLSPKAMPFSGMTSWTGVSHGYRCRDRSASLSGVDGRVALSAQKRPKKIGIWITMGPRQPRGLTPCSR